MLLAIDTATRYMSLALHDGETLVGEQMLRTGNRHNTLLANNIQTMMDDCDVKPEHLTAVAVSIGPGSYTGLRIGVAMAKGIAAVRGLPLVGVSSLDTLAAGQPFQNTRHNLIAVVEAGRKRIITGTYRAKKGRWMPDGVPAITTWDALLAGLEGSFYVTGEVEEDGRKALEEARARDISVTLVSPAYRARRAGFLAQEAWRRLQEADADTFKPAKLLPVYLKSD